MPRFLQEIAGVWSPSWSLNNPLIKASYFWRGRLALGRVGPLTRSHLVWSSLSPKDRVVGPLPYMAFARLTNHLTSTETTPQVAGWVELGVPIQHKPRDPTKTVALGKVLTPLDSVSEKSGEKWWICQLQPQTAITSNLTEALHSNQWPRRRRGGTIGGDEKCQQGLSKQKSIQEISNRTYWTDP